MKDSIKVVFIGLGGRGRNMMSIMLRMPDVEIVGVCDLRPEMLAKGVALVKERRGIEPIATADYQELLRRDEVDAVMVTTGWNEHLELCAEAMLAGKYVATEVGGANSLEQCWEIVRASERSKMPCMMLENCCYGRKEMMVLNMVRQGLFGELIHAEGGYLHDLRKEIAMGYERGHFRHAQNQHRNGDVYPTHALGPIAKCLDINRGNRMMTLTSVSSKGRGLTTWLHEQYGADHEKANYPFAMGDVTTTIIKCAHGETIMLTHSTTLPRPYSRRTVIQGTKGIWMEDKKGFYFEGISEKEEQWDSMDKYYPEYEHPLWKSYQDGGKLTETIEGHGGMDYLVQRAFVEAVKNGAPTPIDVYDTAAWAAITCLSEDSVAMGGQPVPIPDFTNGKWMNRRDFAEGPYNLDRIPEK